MHPWHAAAALAQCTCVHAAPFPKTGSSTSSTLCSAHDVRPLHEQACNGLHRAAWGRCCHCCALHQPASRCSLADEEPVEERCCCGDCCCGHHGRLHHLLRHQVLPEALRCTAEEEAGQQQVQQVLRGSSSRCSRYCAAAAAGAGTARQQQQVQVLRGSSSRCSRYCAAAAGAGTARQQQPCPPAAPRA